MDHHRFHARKLMLPDQRPLHPPRLASSTLQGARAQRIEMLLLHEFHARKFMLPDKLSYKARAAGFQIGTPRAQVPLDFTMDHSISIGVCTVGF